MSIRALLRRFREQPRGQSFVEFALILPVFLVVLSAAVDLGRMAYARVTIANVAREASFQAAQTPTSYQAGQPCLSGAEDDNLVICRAILESTGSVITVTPADIALRCSPTCSETMGNLVSVTATGRFNLLTPVMAVFFGPTITFSSTATNQIASLPSNTAAQPPPPVTTTVPPLIGLTEADAVAAINTQGLTVGTRTEAYSSTYAAGLIISVTPTPGTSVTVGSVVDYVVSKGPAPVINCSTVSAGFTYVITPDPDTDRSPVKVTVTDTTTYNPACVTVWEWIWGDGTTTYGNQTPLTHIYTNPGPGNKHYTLSLKVTSGTFTTTVGGYSITVRP